MVATKLIPEGGVAKPPGAGLQLDALKTPAKSCVLIAPTALTAPNSAGGIEAAQALLVGKWAGSFLHLVAAVLFLVTGILILKKPVIGAEVATIFMAMFFLISGLFQLVASLALQEPDWGWQALNGIITSVLGVLVLAQWPASGLWVIGLFVGIDLIFRGWAWVALALDLRKM